MASVTTTVAQTRVAWWIILIQGIALLIVGFLLITNTAATVVSLVFFLGIWWLISGLMDIVSIFLDRTAWGWKLFSGIIGIIAGLVLMQHPIWSSLLLPGLLIIMLGIFGIIIGVIGIIRAFQGDGWGAGLLGVFSIIFGIILLGNPLITGIIALPLLLGVLGIIGGIVGIWQAFQVKKMQKA